MIFNKHLLKLMADIKNVENRISELPPIINQKNEKVNELEFAVQQLKIDVDKRLNDFYKEFTDRYFETLEAFMRWNKEISLVSYVAGKAPQDRDFVKLKQELMRPLVEEDWNKKNAEEAEKINKALNSKGEKIRQAWERYKEEKLKAEREGGNVALIDAKLDILNKLVENV